MKLLTVLSLDLAFAAAAIAAPASEVEPTLVISVPVTGDIDFLAARVEGSVVTGVPKVVVPSPATDAASETSILPFHIQITEYCENGARKAKGHYKNGNFDLDFNLPPGLINGIDHRVPGYPPFYVGPYDYSTSKIKFTYTNGKNKCEWWDNETWKQCGECRAGLWSSPALNCASGGSRTKDMDCSFILGTKDTASALKARDTLPDPLNVEPVDSISPAGGDTSTGTYAHGHCSFKLQLFNQCIHTPADGWNSQMIGLLFSIEDNDHKTAVTYAEGVGRIDQGAKRLLGMGDFLIAYDPRDKQVYFKFNNGWWATTSKDDGNPFGLCKWNNWTKSDLVCIPEHGVHYRLSDMTCTFKC